MIITEKMKEYFAPDVIEERHIDEYNKALAGRETLHELLEKGDKQVIIFDTGFFVFSIDGGSTATVEAYYRSKESKTPIRKTWEAMIDMFRVNGCDKIIAHAMNKRTMGIFKHKYGFQSLGYDKSKYRYDMEMAI